MFENNILILISIGLVAGVLSGMFGIGGGVFIVPALIFLCGLSLTSASGNSLAVLLLPVSILAVIEYWKAKRINIKLSMLTAIGLLCGVYFGAELALSMPINLLRSIYGVFLFYVSWIFINPMELLKIKARNEKTASIINDEEVKVNPNLMLLVGGFAGIMSGLFGIGGGLVIVPILMTFFRFGPKMAVGTSLGALLLPVGFPGVISYYNAGHIDLSYAWPIAGGLVFGAFLGAKITISLPSLVVKRVYGFFLLIMGSYFILKNFFSY